MPLSLQAIFTQAADPSARILTLLDIGKISEQLQLPPSVLEAGIAHPVSRRRLASTLADRFGFDPGGARESLRLLPTGIESLERALERFSLAAALSAHPAIFRRDDYRALSQVWGDDTLKFALRHRPVPEERHTTPQFPLDRAAAIEIGRTLLVNSLKEAHPAVAAVMALVYDIDLASEGVAAVGAGLGAVAVAALQSAEVMPELAQSADESTGHS